ncbi:unnamed protein product [Staurois parvus]|uniref:Transcription initiation factor TFIID subunit 13 n=1 Tax=Staurois parvus TaxID=386267 RepID=A0ABN9FPK4_9NEOB|nr:unnamed protein product [Staurois parvus]
MADEDEDQTFEEENDETAGGAEGGLGRRKRLFSKELRCMMYGFGDDQNPYTESVDILEDLVIEFITEMTHKAMSIGPPGAGPGGGYCVLDSEGPAEVCQSEGSAHHE